MRAEGRSGWPAEVNICQDNQSEALVAQAVSLGGPHIPVNNAGGWGTGRHQFPLSPRSEWSAVLDLNLRAPMLLTQVCLEPMRRAGGGVVINVASSGGIGCASYGSPEYGAAKAGLIRLTACLAELPTGHGVRAACVVPDWIGLDRAHEQLAALPAEERSATPPLIPPEDVVTAVLELERDTRTGSVVELWGRRAVPPGIPGAREPIRRGAASSSSGSTGTAITLPAPGGRWIGFRR